MLVGHVITFQVQPGLKPVDVVKPKRRAPAQVIVVHIRVIVNVAIKAQISLVRSLPAVIELVDVCKPVRGIDLNADGLAC